LFELLQFYGMVTTTQNDTLTGMPANILGVMFFSNHHLQDKKPGSPKPPSAPCTDAASLLWGLYEPCGKRPPDEMKAIHPGLNNRATPSLTALWCAQRRGAAAAHRRWVDYKSGNVAPDIHIWITLISAVGSTLAQGMVVGR
jgi:hypothetical protein